MRLMTCAFALALALGCGSSNDSKSSGGTAADATGQTDKGGTSDGTADGTTDGTDGTDGTADGTDGTADGTDGTADGTDGTADGTDGTADGTDGTADGTDGTADGTADGTDGTAEVTYSAAAQPIFAQYCSPCHAGSGSGGHDIATTYADAAKASSHCAGKTIGECALIRIQDGSMPLGKGCSGDPAQDDGKAGCLTAEDQATLEAWVAGGMKE